jgi:hypothetical protein
MLMDHIPAVKFTGCGTRSTRLRQRSRVHPGSVAREALKCPPACYSGKRYGGPDVRGPASAEHQGGADLGEGCDPEGLVYQKTAETA